MNFNRIIIHPFFRLLCGILCFTAGLTVARAAEVSDLVINNAHGDLLISAKIRNVIGKEVAASAEDELSATVSFSIALYQVKPFWFDQKITLKTVTNTIKYDPLKKRYSLLRSWDSGPPPVVGTLTQARLLMTELKDLKLMPLARLEKGRHYQIRVQAACQDQNAFIFSPSGCFQTDWYAIDFTF